MNRKLITSLALVASVTAAAGYGAVYLRRETPIKARMVTTAEAKTTASALPAVSAPHSAGLRLADVTSATPESRPNIAATPAIVPVSSRDDRKLAPAFDVVRVESSGDAVIAGSAAPDAKVELLRDGQVQDTIVADQSGQFVMVPSRLPPGSYQLTLRSTQPDGSQMTSSKSVPVAVEEVKGQPTLAALIPNKADDNDEPSYRSLPPSIMAPTPRSNIVSHHVRPHRIGHFFHETRHRYAVAFHVHRHPFANPYPAINFADCLNLAEQRDSGFSSGNSDDPEAQHWGFVRQCMSGRIPFPGQ